MMVFQSQLDAVERPTPRERIGRGKISPMTIHALCLLATVLLHGMMDLPWTPSRGEEEDEDGDESDLCIDSRDVVCNWQTFSIEMRVVETDCNTDNGNDKLR